ncbi:Uncharacterised protein [Legionella busanensis]|uniref:Uncharacterized protein n=1 Tax=Legionella busanensis TaxID=190655 RepID=A0A378KDF6_9GAMM|nr:hypothetical protein [Legionella busanensis]STX81252.1 Uncharacterised protein [Legionella busanensis]
MLKKILFTVGVLFVSTLTAATLKMNTDAVGEKAAHFLEHLDDTVRAFPRALRHQNHVEFDALQLSLLLNQSANIEQKLDVLIAELRKTNQLLAEKK